MLPRHLKLKYFPNAINLFYNFKDIVRIIWFRLYFLFILTNIMPFYEFLILFIKANAVTKNNRYSNCNGSHGTLNCFAHGEPTSVLLFESYVNVDKHMKHDAINDIKCCRIHEYIIQCIPYTNS